MALTKYKAWSLKDKLAGVKSPKEITNEELKKKTEEIKKDIKVEAKSKSK